MLWALTQQLCWVSLEGCLKEVVCKGEGSGYPTGTGSGEHLRSLGRIGARVLDDKVKGPLPFLAAALPIPHRLPPGQLRRRSQSPFPREKFPDRPFRKSRTIHINN